MKDLVQLKDHFMEYSSYDLIEKVKLLKGGFIDGY
jgi:hypothetical protein